MESIDLNLQVVINDRGDTRSIPLGELMTIGRSVQNRVQIEKSYVSSNHAKIERSVSGDYLIADCDSTNGTFVNDEKISVPTKLNSGDTVRFGLATCQVVALEEDAQSVPVQAIREDEKLDSAWVPMIGIEAIKTPSSNELFFGKRKKARKSPRPRNKGYLATRKSPKRTLLAPNYRF